MPTLTKSADRAISVRLLLIAILTLGFAARIVTFRAPLFDFHSWRQADSAAIARNFVNERFNPLYPQIDWRGGQKDGYVETGLELHAFFVAAISKVIGFSPAVGRVLNTLLFPLAALLLFQFVRMRHGDAAGLIAAFIYSVGMPLTVFIDRAFMNESILTLLSIACLRTAQLYCANRRLRDLTMLVAALALIAIVKPTYLIVAGPVAGLFLERFGWSALWRWELFLATVVVVVAGLLWFRHARTLSAMTGLTFGLSNKLFDSAILFSNEYPFIIVRRLGKDILGPIGAMAGMVGTITALRRRLYPELLGVAGFIVYLVIVTEGNLRHNYYQLPIVSMGAVLTAIGIVATVDALTQARNWNWTRQLVAYSIVLWIAAMGTVGRSVSAHNWYELNHTRLRLCEDLKPLLAPDDRVVFANDQSPDVLFCLDRKGWLLHRTQTSAEYISSLVAAGASVAVFQKTDLQFAAPWNGSRPLLETPDFVVFRINR